MSLPKYSSYKSERKSSSRTPKVKKSGNAPVNFNNMACIPLSKTLENFPQFFDETKISIVQKCVNKIDLLPKEYQQIPTLYLSNNNLTSLEGIEQFSNLKTLTLVNNDIDDLPNLLTYLNLLPNLEVLALNGNPVCRQHNYKNILLSNLPKLKLFDGKMVTPEERNEAEVRLRKEKGLLDLMLSNYCELIKLNSFNKKMDMHKTLLLGNLKFLPEFETINLEKFIEIYNYEEYLDKNTKDDLKLNLIKDINTLNKELNPNNEIENIDLAYSELILRQQQKLAELKTKIRQKIESFYELIEKRRINYFESKLKRNELVRSEAIKSERTNRSQGTKKKNNVGSKSNSKKTTSHLIKHKPQFKEKIDEDKDLFQKLNQTLDLNKPFFSRDCFSIYSTPENKDREQFKFNSVQRTQMNPINRYNLNKSENKSVSPYKEIPQPSTYESRPISKVTPHKEECCRRWHKNPTGESKIVRKLSPDQDKEREKKETEMILQNMNRILDEKNEKLKLMEEKNNELNKKLMEFEKQNRENVLIAKSEINNLTDNLEQSVERQTNLDKELLKTKNEMNELLMKTFKLEKESKDFCHSKQKAEEYGKVLENYAKEQNNLEIAQKYNEKRLCRQFLHKLSNAVEVSSKVKNFKSKHENRRIFNKIYHSFFYWRKLAFVRKITENRQQNKGLIQMKRAFSTWKKNLTFLKKYRNFQRKKMEIKKFLSFHFLKKYAGLRYSKKNAQKRLGIYFQKALLKKCFIGLKKNTKNNKLDLIEEKNLTKKALQFRKVQVFRSCFKFWKFWIFGVLKLNQLNQKNAFIFMKKKLQKTMLSFLRNNLEISRFDKLKGEKLWKKRMFRIQLKMFILWKNDFPRRMAIERKQKYLQNCFFLKKNLNTWRKRLEQKRNEQKNIIKSEIIYKIILTKRFFQKLHHFKEYNQRIRLFYKAISQKSKESLLKSSLKNWSLSFKAIRNKKMLEREKNLGAIHEVFIALKSNYVTKKTRKLHMLALEKYLNQKTRAKFLKCIEMWSFATKKKKRSQNVLQNYVIRKNIRMCRHFFYELLKNSSKELRCNLAKTVAKSSLIEANYKENLDYINMIDEQKIEFSEKINALSKEMEDYKEELNEKSQENNILKKKILAFEKEEEIWKSKEESLLKNIEKKEAEKFGSVSEYEVALEEKNRKIEGLLSEIKRLEKSIKIINDETSFKQTSFVGSERKLLEKCNVADKMIQDTEKKLKNSIKMATEFKNKIETQKSEMIEMNKNYTYFQEENYNLKVKLQESLDIVDEANHFFASKIEEYEKIIFLLKDENAFYKDNQERLTRQIKDLKMDLRKYELEVDSLADQKHQEAHNFITSLPNRSMERNPKENKENENNILTDQISFRNGAEKDNFFKSFNESQKEFQIKKLNIQKRINNLQSNLENYLQNTGSANPWERDSKSNETKIMPSELFRTNQKETPKTYLRSNNIETPDNYFSNNANQYDLNQKYTPHSRKTHANSFYSTSNFKDLGEDENNNSGMNYNVTQANDYLTSDGENHKSVKNYLRDNIEKRIKNLNENLENDILRAKSKLQKL